VEQNLGSLGHAGNCFYAEVSKGGNSPGVKIGRYKLSPVFCELEGIQHELGTVIWLAEF